VPRIILKLGKSEKRFWLKACVQQIVIEAAPSTAHL